MNDLRVKIRFDKDTKELVLAQKDLDRFGRSIGEAANVSKVLSGSLVKIGASVGGLYGVSRAFEAIVENGILYNAQLETMQIGIASLINVNSSNITSTGRMVDEQEKFNMAMASSADVVAMLKKANLETSATLAQLTEGFQSAIGPSLAAGLSLKQTVEYTKLMTQAAGAMGLPMNQLAQEMRSVVSGTIDMNSVVAKNIGITNEQIKAAKESGTLYEFLSEKLSGFARAGEAVAHSFDGSVSNMKDAWDGLTGELTKPIFAAASESAQSLAAYFNELAESIRLSRLEVNRLQDIHKSNSIADVEYQLEQMRARLKELKTEGYGVFDTLFGQSGGEKAEIKTLEASIAAAERKLKRLNEAGKDHLNIVNDTKQAHDGMSAAIESDLDWFAKESEATEKAAKRAADTQATATKSLHDMLAAMNESKIDAFYRKLGDTIAKLSLQGVSDEDLMRLYGESVLKYYRDLQGEMRKNTSDAIEAGAEDAGGNIDPIFSDWGQTLNSSISNAITDALMSGDVAGAVQSLGASMGSSLIQSGTANLLQPLTQSLGMSGPWGSVASIGIGLGAAALPSLFGGEAEKSYSDKMLEKIDEELEKQTKRLDTQIALQSSLGLEGASAVSTYSELKLGYDAQQDKFVTQRIDVSPVRDEWSSLKALQQEDWTAGNEALLEFESLFVDIESAGLDASSSMSDFFDAVVEQNSALEVLNTELENGLITQEDYVEWTERIIDANRDYAKSLIDLAAPLQNTADDLNDLYQQLTGEDLLGDVQLQRAREDVAELIGVDNFTQAQYEDYLKSLVTGLDEFGTSIDDMRGDLLSTDAAVQDSAIQALEQLTGQYFDSNEKALDYIDSIELVGQSYIDDMSDSATYAANNITHLGDTAADVTSSWQRIYDTSSRLADKLKADVSSGYSIDRFYTSIAVARAAENESPDVFAAAVDDAASYASALDDSANFSSAFDQRFARATAANTFDSWADKAESQIDLLRDMRDRLDAIEAEVKRSADYDEKTYWRTVS